jgi:hypothetical protein
METSRSDCYMALWKKAAVQTYGRIVALFAIQATGTVGQTQGINRQTTALVEHCRLDGSCTQDPRGDSKESKVTAVRHSDMAGELVDCRLLHSSTEGGVCWRRLVVCTAGTANLAAARCDATRRNGQWVMHGMYCTTYSVYEAKGALWRKGGRFRLVWSLDSQKGVLTGGELISKSAIAAAPEVLCKEVIKVGVKMREGYLCRVKGPQGVKTALAASRGFSAAIPVPHVDAVSGRATRRVAHDSRGTTPSTKGTIHKYGVLGTKWYGGGTAPPLPALCAPAVTITITIIIIMITDKLQIANCNRFHCSTADRHDDVWAVCLAADNCRRRKGRGGRQCCTEYISQYGAHSTSSTCAGTLWHVVQVLEIVE